MRQAWGCRAAAPRTDRAAATAPARCRQTARGTVAHCRRSICAMARWFRAFVAWLVASGCSASIAPIEVADGCPDQPVRGPMQYADDPRSRLIDDFEHDSTFIPEIDGRDGIWVEGDDSTGDVAEA